MRAIAVLMPGSSNFFDPIQLKPIADYYNLSFECLEIELILAKRTLQDAEMDNIGDVLLQHRPQATSK